MRARDKIRRFDLATDELDRQLGDIFEKAGSLDERMDQDNKDFTANKVIIGKIVDIRNDEVVVDIGYKSEGIIGSHEFNDINDYDVGDELEVLLESVDEGAGGVVLSKRKADRIRGWERVVQEYGEGATVRGRVLKKIKGGLLVDIGVPVFLPASQVSIRRTHDISEFIGRDIESRIIKIDNERMNIVISRRKLIEEQREEAKQSLLGEIKAGQIRVGVVKNIADFGAFVDLGGIDGLLHITDMSWSRLTHPSDMLKIEDEIEVMVLRVDHDRERIALGLKQKLPSPWESVELKYPVGSRVQGNVVNVMPYGAFVKLEDGIEGLVHISEMSWSKRVNHPSEVVKVGDEVEVVVLDINREKQEISLGMKQADGNPWDDVDARFPPGTMVEGTVRNLTSYGAFIEIEDGIDGLLHVSDMSWTRKIANPSEVLDKGQHVKAVVLSVHPEKKRIALGLKQLELDPWQEEILDRFGVETEHAGTVTKVTNFGIFISLDSDLEGLLHISELTPADHLQPGDKAAVRVLRLDTDDRKIALALVRDEETQIALLGGLPDDINADNDGSYGRDETETADADAGEATADASADGDAVAEADPAADDDAEAAPAADADAEAAAASETASETASDEPAAEEAPAAEAASDDAEADAAPAEEAAPAAAEVEEPAAEAAAPEAVEEPAAEEAAPEAVEEPKAEAAPAAEAEPASEPASEEGDAEEPETEKAAD